MSEMTEKRASSPPGSTRDVGTGEAKRVAATSSETERRALAEARIDSVLKGYKLTRLLGVGSVTAAYRAERAAKGTKEQAVVKIMIGELAEHEHARACFS